MLLVEDDPLSAEIVPELIHAFGIYPQFAGNGHGAAALLTEEGPAAYDLVLMNVQIPVLDGHAATRLIRSWQSSPHSPSSPRPRTRWNTSAGPASPRA